ncbi:MAG: hypothetical protein IJ068_00390 [Bacilli bacterium]|nr:hypothetical protein [Bacilli bacterium]
MPKKDKCLFKATTKLTDEEFTKINKVFPNLYLNLVITGTIINLVISCILFLIFRKIFLVILFFINYQIAITLLYKTKLEDYSKKVFSNLTRKNKIADNISLEFYDKYIIRITDRNIKINYDEIEKCIETNTNIYLKNKKNVLIIDKDISNIKLVQFIKSKIDVEIINKDESKNYKSMNFVMVFFMILSGVVLTIMILFSLLNINREEYKNSEYGIDIEIFNISFFAKNKLKNVYYDNTTWDYYECVRENYKLNKLEECNYLDDNNEIDKHFEEFYKEIIAKDYKIIIYNGNYFIGNKDKNYIYLKDISFNVKEKYLFEIEKNNNVKMIKYNGNDLSESIESYDELKLQSIKNTNKIISKIKYFFKNNEAVDAYLIDEYKDLDYINTFDLVDTNLESVNDFYFKDEIKVGNKKVYKWSNDFFKEKGMGESKNKLINLYTSSSNKMFYKVVW